MGLSRLFYAASAGAILLVSAGCAADDDTTVDDPAGVVDDSVDSSPSVDSCDSSESVTVPDASELGDRIDTATDALKAGDFSTLLEALSLSSVADEIEGRAVTILAPTDDAFSELAADEIADILANPTRLDDLLKHHIVDGAFSYDDLASMTSVTMLDGAKLPVTSDGSKVLVGGATVSEGPTDATNGTEGEEVVVLSIDRVLTGQG